MKFNCWCIMLLTVFSLLLDLFESTAFWITILESISDKLQLSSGVSGIFFLNMYTEYARLVWVDGAV